MGIVYCHKKEALHQRQFRIQLILASLEAPQSRFSGTVLGEALTSSSGSSPPLPS